DIDRLITYILVFFFESRRRHTILVSDWSSDVCSSDLAGRFGDQPVFVKQLGHHGQLAGQKMGSGQEVERELQVHDGARVAGGLEIGRASCRGEVLMKKGGVVVRRRVSELSSRGV